jgi:hypothetical protein
MLPVLRGSILMFRSLIVIATLISVGCTQSWAQDAARKMTIEVVVAPTKADGNNWDAGRDGPDIFVCIGDGLGQLCLLKNVTAKKNSGDAWCPDLATGSACLIEGVDIRSDTINIQVIDQDWAMDDAVATGSCPTDGTSCNLGLATVRIF